MKVTVQDVINSIVISEVIEKETVDKLEFGDPRTFVKGITVTFLATQEVIEKSIELGVNFIISHEGIFYSHISNMGFLESDPVVQYKLKTIESNNLAVFRLHDNIHRRHPDSIMVGLLKCLNWESYEVIRQTTYSVLDIPKKTLLEVIEYVKKILNVQYLRFVGDLSMECSRVGILVGYRGTGQMAIPLFHKENLDLLIYGEGPEWGTPEYVRDAIQQGRQKALIVLGHAESEKPGMEYIANIIREKFPNIPVHYISQPPIFRIY